MKTKGSFELSKAKPEDLKAIAEFNKIVKNYIKMKDIYNPPYKKGTTDLQNEG